ISSKRSGVLPNLSTRNTMLWRPFVLQYGGFDEQFTSSGLEDIELGLRLKQNGLEIRLLATAIGFHHKSMKVRDLVDRELSEGFSAVSLHSKYPEYLPQVEDSESLMRNAALEKEATSAVEEIALLEQAESSRLPSGVADLFLVIYRYYFLCGILNGLKSASEVRAPNGSSATRSLYHQASHLYSIGEISEARRLFRLVRNRQDAEYWPGAEYHLGRLELESGDPQLARHHFTNCLALNPGHQKAADGLKRPDIFHEIERNVYERIAPLPEDRILVVVFGALDDVMHAFPVISRLRGVNAAEIVWLTSPEFASLARASDADWVWEFDFRGAIPWDAIVAEGYTRVIRPDVHANLEEWKASGLHPMQFMAGKCGVTLESRKASLEPGPEAIAEAEAFLGKHGLTQKRFVTISHAGETRGRWPSHNLHKLAKALGLPVVVIGGPEEFATAGTIACLGRTYRVMAAVIQLSAFYLGPEYGMSWLATTTDTPMGVFTESRSRLRTGSGLKEFLRVDRDGIWEWDSRTPSETVMDHVVSTIQTWESPAPAHSISSHPVSSAKPPAGLI
ncbi:MAG TPA: galactosyltransferase-related protein, partial [Terriglobia bacterium]|nr:galactosyltransferase-related protein [Terriglobia bacterium]